MPTPALQFVHRFEPAQRPNAQPLLLLHGTGGNENDLLPVGQIISPGAALLSPRGQVLENGMPRFFRRLAEGIFDYDDVRRRAIELAQFVVAATESYQMAPPIAVGYSNGANIAAAVLLLKPDILAGAILVRAMLPLDPPPHVDLAGRPVLITSGQRDSVIPAGSANRLAAVLSAAGALVEHKVFPAGHELSQLDMAAAQQWLANAGDIP